jgi:hypothetical protein
MADNNTEANPRYAAYARAHGMTPAEMLEHDRQAWPGGCMCGFVLWMAEQKKKFHAVQPSAFLDRHTIADQTAWTGFLQATAQEAQRQ